MKNNDIQDLLRKVVNPIQKTESKICIVREYTTSTQTINVEPVTSDNFDPLVGNVDHYVYGVQLTSFLPQTHDTVGFVLIPKILSYVVISPLENSGWFASLTSEITTFQFYTEGKNLFTMGVNPQGIQATNLFTDTYMLRTIDNNDIYMSFDKDGKYIHLVSNGEIDIQCVDNYTLYTDGDIDTTSKGDFIMTTNGQFQMTAPGASMKSDILSNLQSVVQSLDMGLTALGGVDPARTANIALLLTKIGMLFKD